MAYVRILRTSVTQKFAFYLLLKCVLRISGVVIPLFKYRLKVLWQAERKLLILAGLGVFKAQKAGVKGVARHCLKAVLNKLLVL